LLLQEYQLEGGYGGSCGDMRFYLHLLGMLFLHLVSKDQHMMGGYEILVDLLFSSIVNHKGKFFCLSVFEDGCTL